MAVAQAEVGVFGGSGFYALLDDVDEIKLETPYGPPSDKVALATIGERRVAFLPRHGKYHTLPPHTINYRANVWAMHHLGVRDIFAPTASGSLQKHIKPGELVLCDQFVDRTSGRKDTFYDGPVTTHASAAEPYCPILREHAAFVLRARALPYHATGTVVVIQGPRFSTRAESQWYSQQGWDVINMTQYPECWLARELEMSYVNISLITDYDAGVVGELGAPAVTAEEMLRVFRENTARLRDTLIAMIATLPDTSSSPARNHLEFSRI
jgi:5'-methylthioadenosine phosphorylase